MDLQLALLQHLEQHTAIQDTRQLTHLSDSQLVLKAALDSLAARGYVAYDTRSVEVWLLSQEGLAILDQGSPEYRVWQACAGQGTSMAQLQSLLGAETTKIGQANAFRRKWIHKKGDFFTQNSAAQVTDTTRAELVQIQQNGTLQDAKALKEIKSRTLILPKSIIFLVFN